MFIDTHCHIHEPQYFSAEAASAAIEHAIEKGVSKFVCVGTSELSSRQAVDFALKYSSCVAVVGVHPHDTKDGIERIETILRDHSSTISGIGEIGLDYYYGHSPKSIQIHALETQLQWAIDYDKPVSFHVRDAFDDFWPIFANFTNLRGVLHSFTDTMKNLEKGLGEGLYIGVNGISTFSKTNQAMWDAIPLEKMLLETDSPYLTPVPHRGKVNEPAFVRHVAEYHANRRKVELEHLARVTSANASKLFSLS